jgi:hypothetical protein
MIAIADVRPPGSIPQTGDTIMRINPCLAAMIAVFFSFAVPVHAVDIAGTWTKTTHPDPNNILVLYGESEAVKMIGYEQVGNAPAFWYGEGEIRNGKMEILYHYSADGTPQGWESEGSMHLTLSEDGNTFRGTATSASGNWSDLIEFRRVSLVIQR